MFALDAWCRIEGGAFPRTKLSYDEHIKNTKALLEFS
jgi:hypothetical protein